MRITIVEVNPVIEYPPVISLLRILVKQGHSINLITRGSKELPIDLLNSSISVYDIAYENNSSKLGKLRNKLSAFQFVRECTEECMKESDVLWTTSANTIKVLGRQVLKYKNVMQLMELVDNLMLVRNHISVPIAEIARNSWKVVVPEINRAFIEQTWWNLDQLPYVLPNKPFDLDPGSLYDSTKEALRCIKADNSKKLLYLGGIWPDRDLTVFAKAAKEANNYKLYIIGKPYGNGKNHLEDLINKYEAVYLGGFPAPQHLAFLPYARIGLLPYKAAKSVDVSILNALFCAPNKIYEYAGYGIPMIGSYVPGLLMPFERYGIGYCCKEENTSEVLEKIELIEQAYDTMSNNCKLFYNAIDNESIVKEILEQ